ncbi:DUF4873 domain-containing protein [Dactylosporangium vinaceum]|uniref:DUF4873 domain-containing protein n=1 Tax=Dactylosporangium vinaceum TaxID=53362 RepID=A0ABV5MHD9_9ACTN|nr:DUF4873 domain-containing protein [Dactylosporangium vinaceum]UAB94812.1 DUF4873 domain-containing protein [Dactylosporangium vinaceum]
MPEESSPVKATLVADGRSYAVELEVSGRSEPVDGRFRWSARMTAGPEVTALLRCGRRDVTIGGVPARLVELNPWGGIRVTGSGPLPSAGLP